MIRSRGAAAAAVTAPTTTIAFVEEQQDNDSKRRTQSHRISRQRRHQRVLLLSFGITTIAIAILDILWNNHDHNHHLANDNSSSDGGTILQSWLRAMQQQDIISSLLSFNSDNQQYHQGKQVQQQQQPCRYDGHCPVGTTCAVVAADVDNHDHLHRQKQHKNKEYTISWPGLCRTIPIDKRRSPTRECIEACRAELQMDEHFYHESWPHILKQYTTTTGSSGRPPNGCVLIYKRQRPENLKFVQRIHARDDNNNPSHMIAPSIQNWTRTRFRHIVRVDPVLGDRWNDQKKINSAADNQQWMAYCMAPCRDDADCQPTSSLASSSSFTGAPLPFLCHSGACQRNQQFWENNKQQEERDGALAQGYAEQTTKQLDNELVIVTGADSSYFGGLVNLIKSVKYWAPHVKMVVYNLGGWSPEQVTILRHEPNVLSLEWITGIPSKYPNHVRQANLYAWKPIIIQETLDKYKMIFWLDAGSTLTGPITPVVDILKRTGIFLVKGQDASMITMSNPVTYQWFNYSKTTMKTGPHFSGNTQAYLSPSRYVDSIVNLNAACALDPNCINPHTASIFNHRYDQTSLSICAYQPHVQAPHYTEYLACCRDQLPTGFPYDEAAFRFVWTSRQASQDYIIPPVTATVSD